MDTAEQIRRYLEEHYAPARRGIRLNDHTRLLEEKVIDSIGMLEVLLFVEETLNMPVPEEDLTPDHFATVGKLAAYIDGRRNSGAH